MKSILLFLLASTLGYSQTSSVTATITDPDGQTWNNGSYTITFVPTPGIPGPFTWQGNPNFPQNYTGSFSGAGVLTVSIPDNNFIAPLGSKWQFTLCGNTSAPCQNVTLSVTGASPDLSFALRSPLIAPRFGPGQFAFGYLDVEVSGALLPGAFYFNVTNLIQRIWTGTSWVNNAGGGGSLTGSGTNGNYAGWNGPTGLTNAPATFSGNNTTFVGSMASASDGVHAGAAQLIGNTTVPTLPANTFSLIGPNSASFTAYGIQFPPTPPTNGQVPTAGTPSGGITTFMWAAPAGGIAPPANPQPGDTLRYSINGSGNWETSNFSMPLTVATAQLSASGAIGVVGYGSITGNPTLASAVTQSRIDPNLSNGVGDVITSPASTASLNTITGFNHGAATNIGTIGVGSFYRWSMKFAATATTNVRYWMGYANYNTGGGSGTENVSVMNTTSLATDTPSRGLIGFRFSSGTDTNWQAVACLPAGTCTVTDTGVAIDTNVHVFEMATQPSGTSVKYFIDGGNLVTISSNVPPPNLGVASAGSTGSIFWVGDNKNTANAVSGNFYWMTLTPK